VTAEDWRRVRDLFERALDEEPADIQTWVARQAAGDRSVAAEVLSLLEHHSQAGAFLTASLAASALEDDGAVLPEGLVVGQYTVVREIGRGGMGRVYLARDARLGRPVALKALLPRLTDDPRQRERLRREARAAAVLTHPGICTIYALEEHDGNLFIAAEYVDGHTLRDEIGSGRRPAAADLLTTAREITAALAAAHQRGVTHRDLKPENVMRTRDGRIKILDFGLARVESHADGGTRGTVTEAGVLVGTPAYMAPEQLSGGHVDARADVFALGVLLYEYACGTHPFAAPTSLAVAARVLEGTPPPLEASCPGLPLSLAAVIERCLRKLPADRFASAAEVLAALGRSDLSPRRHVARWWRTHQITVIGLYLLAAAVMWQLKEWQPGAAALFAMVGVSGTIGGVFRGHLLFTERQNPVAFPAERRRAQYVTLIIDLVIAGALIAAAGGVAGSRQLAAVLTVALAVGLALARLVLERSTASAAFD
jgi:predicted Ser/Thr protein kinase